MILTPRLLQSVEYCCRSKWLQVKSAHFLCCSNSYWQEQLLKIAAMQPGSYFQWMRMRSEFDVTPSFCSDIRKGVEQSSTAANFSLQICCVKIRFAFAFAGSMNRALASRWIRGEINHVNRSYCNNGNGHFSPVSTYRDNNTPPIVTNKVSKSPQ